MAVLRASIGCRLALTDGKNAAAHSQVSHRRWPISGRTPPRRNNLICSQERRHDKPDCTERNHSPSRRATHLRNNLAPNRAAKSDIFRSETDIPSRQHNGAHPSCPCGIINPVQTSPAPLRLPELLMGYDLTKKSRVIRCQPIHRLRFISRNRFPSRTAICRAYARRQT